MEVDFITNQFLDDRVIQIQEDTDNLREVSKVKKFLLSQAGESGVRRDLSIKSLSEVVASRVLVHHDFRVNHVHGHILHLEGRIHGHVHGHVWLHEGSLRRELAEHVGSEDLAGEVSHVVHWHASHSRELTLFEVFVGHHLQLEVVSSFLLGLVVVHEELGVGSREDLAVEVCFGVTGFLSLKEANEAKDFEGSLQAEVGGQKFFSYSFY